jgi:hypothetical protein
MLGRAWAGFLSFALFMDERYGMAWHGVHHEQEAVA